MPRFHVGPRDTPGLSAWLHSHGYRLETRESVVVLRRSCWPDDNPPREAVEVSDRTMIRQILWLDHLVFDDPEPDDARVAVEWSRLSPNRRQFLIPGPDGMARAAGGFTVFPGRWLLLWGGETHPDHRRQGLYRDILDARFQAARDTRAAFAAVYANIETSAPILLATGFKPIGLVEVWAPRESQRDSPRSAPADDVGDGRITREKGPRTQIRSHARGSV